MGKELYVTKENGGNLRLEIRGGMGVVEGYELRVKTIDDVLRLHDRHHDFRHREIRRHGNRHLHGIHRRSACWRTCRHHRSFGLIHRKSVAW
jgi:hypothetical protein